ncbi:PD40 domain-containing protein, partial [bacterium]|nr:PD40 domain-containing protein [bacterium]
MRSRLPWLALSLCLLRLPCHAAPTPEQQLYWWQDEIRTVAWELAAAQKRAIPRWPRFSAPAGQGILPVPTVALDDPLGDDFPEGATSFPVGPLFGPWADGPFTLQVKACHDGASLHLLIKSPETLDELGSLAPPGRLLTVNGKPLAKPLTGRNHRVTVRTPPGKPVTLAFAVELVRRTNGKLPAGADALGLAAFATGRDKRRKTALWLEPIRITLKSAPKGITVPDRPESPGVSLFAWKAPKGQPWQLSGFRYAETVHDTGIKNRRTYYCAQRMTRATRLLAQLDAPLLFVKQHPYYAAHIYDDYYTWRPGGGLYIADDAANPASPARAVIAAESKPTLGDGVYRDPDLSWDGRRVLFAYKATQKAMTWIYEIGADGKGLKRLTSSERFHDITPAYLPDDRIVFTSTRPRGRVPCFNSGVDTLHTMNGDGTNIVGISANNVNEFDPSVLPDGRILYGRWEYVDKTALYMQSLWTMFPDGRNETALFANNMAMPTALLDARGVPGTQLVVASLTPHNGQAAGAIGIINPAIAKNSPDAITNLTPEYPALMNQGLRNGPCDPWALSADVVLMSNNAIAGHAIIEMVTRSGERELVRCDPAISCYAPMLVKPRPRPTVITPVDKDGKMGRFLVMDVYQGLAGVKRGTVTHLRIVEETARTSEVPPGGRWWNQAFLISWQGAYVVKNILGVVPVHEDGSAWFEAPPSRALYFEALDAEGREVQRMRTFVQAVPGDTRTCIGCHEHKLSAPANPTRPPQAVLAGVSTPAQESWGSGFVDFPTMVQPILDKHCVGCHGGDKGMANDMDLSGGWTWAFNIAFESLLKNNLVGFIRCNNGDTTSSDILPPRTIGSGRAPLGKLLVSGHKDRIPKLTRPERDLIMAWMDLNSSYYGTWDTTPVAVCKPTLAAGGQLGGVMRSAGCVKCHAAGHIGNDWVNLRSPERSRILRAPLAAADKGLGLAWCRPRKAPSRMPLVTQRQLPADVFRPPNWPKRDPSGAPHISFTSTSHPHYQEMLAIIRRARAAALAAPRVDMPGARPTPGVCRLMAPLPIPDSLPHVKALIEGDAVRLAWDRRADTIGLHFEVHRAPKQDFLPTESTRLVETPGFRYTDLQAPPGDQHYALVLLAGKQRSAPVRTHVSVPAPKPPATPTGLTAKSASGEIALAWSTEAGAQSLIFRA